MAFHKGSFIIGLSEGSTFSDYGTSDVSTPHPTTVHEHIHGVRDPLTLEYGISKHWGIGVNMGNDIFMVNPGTFYGSDVLNTSTKAATSEFTLDASYHFYVTRKADLSLVGSFGSSSVTLKGNSGGDAPYQYIANGGIVRLGLHAKYYFWKRLGVQAMWSLYSQNTSTKDVKGNTFGSNYTTSIKGRAFECGFVFRLGKIN